MKFNLWYALAAIIIAILLASTWYLYGLNNTASINNSRLAEQKRLLEKELDNLSKQKQVLETEFADSKKEKESLISKINEYDGKIQDMTTASEAKVQQLTSEINRLRAELSKNEKELPKKDEEIAYLKKMILNSRTKIAGLNKKLNENPQPNGARGSVNLPQITVTPAAQKINAKVVEVNTEYGFIVIDAGEKGGVKAGDTLFVSRDKELLGKVVVEKTRDTICVAKILYKSLTDAVRKGDEVSN